MGFRNEYYESRTSSIRFKAKITKTTKRLSIIKDKVYEPVGYTYSYSLFGKRAYTNFVIPTEHGKEIKVLKSDVEELFHVEKA